MKSRIVWFLFFYIILGLFVCYNIVYLGVIWSNKDLLNLYNAGFETSGSGKELFNYSSAFAVYGLPTLGTLFSLFGLMAAVLSQSFILKTSTPKSKLIVLVASFTVLIIGFYLTFIGQLFYNEWNDTSVMVNESGKTPVSASFYYRYWLSLANIWIIFVVFFILFIVCIVLIIKLHFSNLQWMKYGRKESDDELELEITSPFPANAEFDPNETQTITLSLDTDKEVPWKKPRKKTKVKKRKSKKK